MLTRDPITPFVEILRRAAKRATLSVALLLGVVLPLPSAFAEAILDERSGAIESAKPDPAVAEPRLKELQFHWRDPAVVTLRRRLIEKGYLPNSEVADPTYYDKSVLDAVRAFQSRNGLKRTGNVGKSTLEMLLSANAKTAMNEATSGARKQSPGTAPATGAPPPAAPKPPPIITRLAESERTSTAPDFGAGALERIDAKLVELRAMVSTGYIIVPEGRELTYKGRGPAVVELRRRLVQAGALGLDAATSDQFDLELVNALRRFQAQNGISPTGNLGPQTRAALNARVEDHIAALTYSRAQLAGKSWPKAGKFIVANIANASVELISDGALVHRQVAVFGRADRATPVLDDRIVSVDFAPSWTVPKSIAVRDLIPRQRKDPGFLERQSMVVVNGKGSALSPTPETLARVAEGRAFIRQRPGPDNALGAVRFLLTNGEAIFLHDTPSKRAFRKARSDRFLSSGCVRLSEPERLANFVLEGRNDWGEERVKQAVAAARTAGTSLETTRVTPNSVVPVKIVYIPAWVDSDGFLQVRTDIYRKLTAAPANSTAQATPNNAKPTPQ